MLVGSDFWSGLLDWMREIPDRRFHTISPEDVELFHLTDDEQEAVDIVHDTFTGKRKCAERLPRFVSDEAVPTGEGTRLGIQPRRGGRTRPRYEQE